MTRGVQALFGLSALVVPGVVLLLTSGRGDAALGLGLGHAAAQAVSLTWLVAAARRFDDTSAALLRSTLGLAPVRVLLLIAAMLVGPRLGADAGAIFGGFLVTLVVGHLVEAWALGALADAARAARRASPGPGG